MARPLHHFLKEFGSTELDSDEPPFQPPMPKPPAPVIDTGPAPDVIASRLQEAYQQGVEAGRAIEREAAEAQSAELAVDFDRRLEEVRRTFSQGLVDGLLDELRAGLETARLTVSSHVATALVPMLREGLTRAAIASFVDELGGMITTAEGLAIEVACPRTLAEPLRQALGEAMAKRGAPPGSVRCIPGDGAEIRVTLNETVIETRLADWQSRLEGVLR